MHFNPWEVVLLLLATIGPLKVTIVAASMTAGAPAEFVKQVSARAVLTASLICLAFAIFGEVILLVFKVSVPALEIAGGIIVLLFSIDMVAGAKADSHSDGDGERALSPNIAVSPLAIPLMASVSGLVAIVSILAESNNIPTMVFLSVVIVGIMALNYVCLRYSAHIVNAVGESVFEVVGKIMGLILAALAIELILAGLVGLGLITLTQA